MSNKITEEQRDKMRFRRSVIKDKLRSIEQLITGRTANFMLSISDKDGRVSKDKTERLINDMLGSLRRYIAYDKNRALGEDSIKMYESFLYCAVMGLGFIRSRRSRMVWKWSCSSTFEDIIRLAENVEPNDCGSYNDYLRDCYRAHREALDEHFLNINGSPVPVTVAAPVYIYKDSDFFIGIKRSLESLGFPVFVDCLPEKTLERLRLGYEQNTSDSDSHSDSDEKMEMAEIPELPEIKNPAYDYAGEDYPEYDDEDDFGYDFEYDETQDSEYAFDESYLDYLAEREEEEYKRERIEQGLESLGEDKAYSENEILKNFSHDDIVSFEQSRSSEEFDCLAGKWKGSVVFDKDLLCEHFYRFLWLYFDDPNRGFFASDVENMVDTFLCEQGASAFSLGDNFAMVNHYVDQMESRIEREIGRKIGK